MKIKRLLAGLILSVMFSVAAVAQTANEPTTSENPITDPHQVARHFEQIVRQPEYQESDDIDTNERLRDWLSQWLTGLGTQFGQMKYVQQMPRFAALLMTLFVLLALATLVYVLKRLIRQRPDWERSELARDSDKKPFASPDYYAEELRRAVGEQDWRGAWLASWRQLLSRLELSCLVEADRSRTNREYLTQIQGRSLPEAALTILGGMVETYDTFIYGRRQIAEGDWAAFQQQADEASLLLHLPNRAVSGKAASP